MTEATLTWSHWQALLSAFACSFSRRGFRRFAEWITALVLRGPNKMTIQCTSSDVEKVSYPEEYTHGETPLTCRALGTDRAPAAAAQAASIPIPRSQAHR